VSKLAAWRRKIVILSEAKDQVAAALQQLLATVANRAVIGAAT
jgi:hypothetical protein